MKAQITLKSGAQITFDTDNLTTGRDRVHGNLCSLKWETPDNWTEKLFMIELDEIAAIVLLDGGPNPDGGYAEEDKRQP